MAYVKESFIESKKFLEQLKNNDAQTIDTFVNLYYPKLYRYFLLQGFSSHHSMEIVQETICKFLSKLKSSNQININNISSYLFKIARNCAMDEFRKYTKEKKLLQNYSSNLTIEHTDNNDSRLKALLNLLQKLDSIEREVIILHTVLGKTFVEISEILNISLSSSKRMFYKAFEKLRILYFSKVNE